MKFTTFLFIGILCISFSSCNKEIERSYTEFETLLNVDIPLISTSSSDDLKSVVGVSEHEFLFSGTNDYMFTDLMKASGGIKNIHNLKSLNGSVLSMPGIEEGHTISSLLLHWGYKTLGGVDFIMKEPIDLMSLNYALKNGIFEVNIDDAINQLIGEIENPDVTIKFSISGKSDFNLSSTANLHIPIIVESEITTPRFELF